jgi:hypothetical protein
MKRPVSRTAVALAALGLLALVGCRTTGGSKIDFERTSFREKAGGYFQGAREFLATCLERDILERVKPWERNLLAREDMGWEPDPVRTLRRTHIFVSKEAAAVGGGTGGGGCGCN